MDLGAVPIVDHHAHPLSGPEAGADPDGFRRWFSESIDPEIRARHLPNSLVLKAGVRWLAELAGCEPTLEAFLAARAALPYEAWCRRLFEDATIAVVLCDYGYRGPSGYDHDGLKSLLPCRVEPILRLEALAEELLVRHQTFDGMRDEFVAAVGRARGEGYVALKSIIAYRTGLTVDPVSRTEAAAAFGPVRDEAGRTGHVRLASKPLCDHLIGLAVEQAGRQHLPLQFHTGFGDRDADLRLANPLQLRSVIERASGPVVLLHAGWPFHREAAHLASIYANVWLDLSLAVPLAGAGIPGMIRDILGMAPLSKVMFATDAVAIPEMFWLAARWGRWGLGRVLDEFQADGFLDQGEARSAAEAILGDTAARLYELS